VGVVADMRRSQMNFHLFSLLVNEIIQEDDFPSPPDDDIRPDDDYDGFPELNSGAETLKALDKLSLSNCFAAALELL